MTVRTEKIGNATLYLGDCRDLFKEVGKVDAVVTDPPYGIGEAAGKNVSRVNTTNPHVKPRNYGDDTWDDEPCSAEVITALRYLSKWQIIFGGNYFDRLGPTSCWLVWDKLNSGDFADCELAWTNLKKAVRRIQWRWNGMIRRGDDEREHPTQKPVGVMTWCIEHLPADVVTIFDPFMGSGTTGVAAIKMGKRFIGIEREEKYFAIACRRLEEAMRQPDLLVSSPPLEATQPTLPEVA